jgi:hypothetical protein
MGSDDFDYSYYHNLRSSRGSRREAPEREREHYARKPRAQEPRVGLLRAVKEILLDDPDASIGEIIERLNTHIRVSPIVVSAIKTEFRHSLRVIRAAGLMKE